jgi:hypothetical protein
MKKVIIAILFILLGNMVLSSDAIITAQDSSITYYHYDNINYTGYGLSYKIYKGGWKESSNRTFAKWYVKDGLNVVDIYSVDDLIWKIEYKEINPKNNIAQTKITRVNDSAHTGWINLRVYENATTGMDLKIRDIDKTIGWTDGSYGDDYLYLYLKNPHKKSNKINTYKSYYHTESFNFIGNELSYKIYKGGWKESNNTTWAKYFEYEASKIVEIYTDDSLIWEIEYKDLNEYNNIAKVRIVRIGNGSHTGWINLKVYENDTTGMDLIIRDIDETVRWTDGSYGDDYLYLYLKNPHKKSNKINTYKSYYHTESFNFIGNELSYKIYKGGWKESNNTTWAKYFEYEASKIVEIYTDDSLIWEIEYKDLNEYNNIAKVRIVRIGNGSHTGWINLKVYENPDTGIDLKIVDIDEYIGWTDGSYGDDYLYLYLKTAQ